jgi:hypothetical protein
MFQDSRRHLSVDDLALLKDTSLSDFSSRFLSLFNNNPYWKSKSAFAKQIISLRDVEAETKFPTSFLEWL